ncbi:hypothetical protein [Nocardioides marinquilinus]|uniref:hypothetical protein n=1 Tax=Nocardioides marinquilinus TaxID=1210400 RepID=UPI0031F062FD
MPLALSSCIFTPEGTEGLALYNDSGEDLVITIAETGREISLDSREFEIISMSGCYDYDLTARSAIEDRLVANLDATVCDGQQWTVHGEGDAQLTDD